MKAELELYVTDTDVIMNPEGSALLLRAQLVDHTQSGPQRSGKHIHLTMTRAEADRLRIQLQGLLGSHMPPGKKTFVPPAKDRN